MSQPKRLSAFLTEHPEGAYCYYTEYAALAAENERLKQLVESNLNIGKKVLGQSDALRIERDALAAENERLRSYINEIECIGDDLAGMVGHADVTGDAHQMMLELYDAWNAAKEGGAK